MKKQILAAALLLLTLALPAQAAKRQKPNTPQQLTFQHPWQGKRVAYFGDSITDPNIKASKVKYWGFLQQWLGITRLRGERTTVERHSPPSRQTQG